MPYSTPPINRGITWWPKATPGPSSTSHAANLQPVFSILFSQLCLRGTGVVLIRYANPAQARTLPSAYLRSALPAHVKLRSGCVVNNKNGATTKGVLRTRKRQRVDSKLLTQAASDDHKDNGNRESSAAADGLDCNLTVAATVATTLTSSSTGSHTSPAKRKHHEDDNGERVIVILRPVAI